MESVEIAPRDSSSAVRGRAMDPLAGRLGDRYGLTVRPVRVSVGRWRRGFSLLITGDDPGTMGRTRSRIRVFQGSASAALLSACSGRCYIPGRPQRPTSEPEVVGTGSRPSVMAEVIIGDDPVAMACTAVGTVGLYSPTSVHRRST